MDKYEYRRERLRELRDTHCHGKNVELADKLGKSDTYVSRMLYETGKKGAKRIGDDMLDVISKAFNVPKSWLDGSDVNIQFGNSFGDNNNFGDNNHFGNNLTLAHAANEKILSHTTMPDQSLNPVIPQGSSLWLDENEQEIVDGKIYLIEYDGMQRYRRLFQAPKQQITMKVFANHEFDEYTAPKSEIKILGRVIRWTVDG